MSNEIVKWHGLKEQMLNAKSKEELDALVAIGKTFIAASPKTRNAWVHAYAKRSVELRG